MSRILATVQMPEDGAALVDVGPLPYPKNLRVWYRDRPCAIVGIHMGTERSTAEFEPAP